MFKSRKLEKLIFSTTLVFALVCGVLVPTASAAENASGWLDTCGIATKCTTGVLVSTKCFQLSDFEDIRLIVKVNDTATAGFKSDSVGLIVGFQTGIEVLNGNGARDTCFEGRVILDTLLASEFGAVAEGLSGPDGSITILRGGADTSSVTGFATASYWFVPEWDGLIRFWVKGLSSNEKTNALKLFLEPRRRIIVKTR